MRVIAIYLKTIGRNMLVRQFRSCKSGYFTFMRKCSVIIRLSTDSMTYHIRIGVYQRSSGWQDSFHDAVIYLRKPVNEVTDMIGIFAVECPTLPKLVFQIILHGQI